QDRRHHQGKEFLERCAHQPQALRRLKRDERRAQADINREHATDPDDGTEYVEREGERGHERLPVRRKIKRYYPAGAGSRSENGLCVPLAAPQPAPPGTRWRPNKMTTRSFTRRTAIVDAHAHLYDGGANRYGIFARKD